MIFVRRYLLCDKFLNHYQIVIVQMLQSGMNSCFVFLTLVLLNCLMKKFDSALVQHRQFLSISYSFPLRLTQRGGITLVDELWQEVIMMLVLRKYSLTYGSKYIAHSGFSLPESRIKRKTQFKLDGKLRYQCLNTYFFNCTLSIIAFDLLSDEFKYNESE